MLTLFVLWASTTAFVVLNTLFSQYLILRDAYITWSSDSSTNAGYDDEEILKYLHAGVCGGTATLTINVHPSEPRNGTKTLGSENTQPQILTTFYRYSWDHVVARVRTMARQLADPRPLRPPLGCDLRYGLALFNF